MKKNLMTVIILALVLVNLVLTAILAFTIIPQTRKSNQLIDKIASAIDLELEDGSSKDTAAVPVEDIEVYDIEASFTVNLSPSGDGKDHVAVFSIGLSLNTKSDGYKSIGTEGLKAKETLIKNDINTIVSGYTMEQFREDEQSVKDAILEDLQEMFGSDFIVGVHRRWQPMLKLCSRCRVWKNNWRMLFLKKAKSKTVLHQSLAAYVLVFR